MMEITLLGLGNTLNKIISMIGMNIKYADTTQEIVTASKSLEPFSRKQLNKNNCDDKIRL